MRRKRDAVNVLHGLRGRCDVVCGASWRHITSHNCCQYLQEAVGSYLFVEGCCQKETVGSYLFVEGCCQKEAVSSYLFVERCCQKGAFAPLFRQSVHGRACYNAFR